MAGSGGGHCGLKSRLCRGGDGLQVHCLPASWAHLLDLALFFCLTVTSLMWRKSKYFHDPSEFNSKGIDVTLFLVDTQTQ